MENEVYFYDPEYDRIVDESVPRKQYEYFKSRPWFKDSYERFLEDEFIRINDSNRHLFEYLFESTEDITF